MSSSSHSIESVEPSISHTPVVYLAPGRKTLINLPAVNEAFQCLKTSFQVTAGSHIEHCLNPNFSVGHPEVLINQVYYSEDEKEPWAKLIDRSLCILLRGFDNTKTLSHLAIIHVQNDCPFSQIEPYLTNLIVRVESWVEMCVFGNAIGNDSISAQTFLSSLSIYNLRCSKLDFLGNLIPLPMLLNTHPRPTLSLEFPSESHTQYQILCTRVGFKYGDMYLVLKPKAVNIETQD